MNVLRNLSVHLAALGVAAAVASYFYTREKSPLAEVQKDKKVEVWGGTIEQLEAISYEGDKRKVRLEARKDEAGSYFVGSVEREITVGPPPRRPPEMSNPDAGPPKMETKQETLRFVGVKEANTLAAQLAPLFAVRKVGKIGKDREEEFGLHEPQGTIAVRIGGKEHKLVLGGTAPGGSDRYARESGTGQLFAINGEIANRVMYAESRLLERELHAFPSADVTRARIEKDGRTRELVPVKGKADGWASPATPEKLDETAGNWMSKLNRLRVTDYVEKPEPAPGPDAKVVRVQYFAKTSPVGFMEVYRLPPAGEGQEPEYVAKTENSRWYFKVLRTTAQEVEQDLPSVLK